MDARRTDTTGADHRSRAQLDAQLERIAAAPAALGTLELVVRRPAVGEREVLDAGELARGMGLVGDNFAARWNRHHPDGTPDPLAALNVMGARSLDAVSGGDRSRWPLAGDQLIIDLDVSADNLPAGTRLRIGGAVIEVTAKPHTGCAKFAARFGQDAARWVNSRPELRLRGFNALVVEPGTVRPGDPVRKL
jgi:MOSC domain-containing protein YiiM